MARNKLLRQEEMSRMIPDKECSFKPKINQNSHAILDKRDHRRSSQQQSPAEPSKEESSERINQSFSKGPRNHQKGSSSDNHVANSFHSRPGSSQNAYQVNKEQARKQNEKLVRNRVERQIREVIRYVISSRRALSNTGVSFAMVQEVLYLLGTFQVQRGSSEFYTQKRKQKESKFLLDLWNMLKPSGLDFRVDTNFEMDLSSQFIDEYWVQQLLVILYTIP